MKIIFVPWSSSNAEDFSSKKDRISSWENNFKNKGCQYSVVNAGGDGKPLAFEGSTAEHQIYIRGHGGAGRGAVSNSNWPDKKVMKADAIVSELIRLGFDSSFSGKVKCYNCHSAEGGDRSFAAQIHSFLLSKEFHSVRVYGYEGSVSGAYIKAPDIVRDLAKKDIEERKDAINWFATMGTTLSSSDIKQLADLDAELMELDKPHKWACIQGSNQLYDESVPSGDRAQKKRLRWDGRVFYPE